MTTRTGSSQTLNLDLDIGKGRGWKDAFVVGFLAVVLGAFVAQISSSPRHAAPEAMTSAAAAIATLG